MGKAAAKKFADNGDIVYILGRNPEKLESVTMANKDKTVIPIVTDVTDLESIKSAKEYILDNHTKIDVLVNCAGGRGDKTIADDAPIDELIQIWEDVVKLNLSSVYYMIQSMQDIIGDGGRIINISSLAALTGSSQGGVIGTAYAAAKSGIHGIDRTLAKSLGERKITINSIAPGLVQDTDFFGKSGIPDRVRDRYKDSILVGRLGEPEDIAAGIFYLASDEAGFITGEILNINGGVTFGR